MNNDLLFTLRICGFDWLRNFCSGKSLVFTTKRFMVTKMIALEGHLHVWIHFVTSNHHSAVAQRHIPEERNPQIIKTQKQRCSHTQKTYAPFFDPIVHFHAMGEYTTSRGIAPLILDLGIRWSWVVNFKRRPLYRPESSTVSIGQKPIWSPELVWSCRNSNLGLSSP